MDSVRPCPAYVGLGVDEISRRAVQARVLLGPNRCGVCPRLCRVDRLHDVKGLCRIGRTAVVASHFAHFGEENCLRGWNGSGTIFFSGCNLRCVFCQNHDISWEVCGERVSPQRLAQMMLELQDKGCHNINFVTPEHVVPQILEALPPAIDAGLRLPIVYNTSSYDSLDSLALMDGIVDIYMPDAKVWSRERARRFLRLARLNCILACCAARCRLRRWCHRIFPGPIGKPATETRKSFPNGWECERRATCAIVAAPPS